MSTDNLTTTPQISEHSSASVSDQELENVERILRQCQVEIARHSLALRDLWPQHDELCSRARSARRQRDQTALQLLLVPTRFFSIEEATPETISINISSPEESHTHYELGS